jgi:hypothetical protein
MRNALWINLAIIAIATSHAKPTDEDFPRFLRPYEIADAVFASERIVLAKAVDTGVVARYRHPFETRVMQRHGVSFEVLEVIKGSVDSKRASLLRRAIDTLVDESEAIRLSCTETLPQQYYDTVRIGELYLLDVRGYSTGWHVIDVIGEGLSRHLASFGDPIVAAVRRLAEIATPGDDASRENAVHELLRKVEAGSDKDKYPAILGNIAAEYLRFPSPRKSFDQNRRIYDASADAGVRRAAGSVIARSSGPEARSWISSHIDSLDPRDVAVYFARNRDSEGISRVLADYPKNFRSPIRAAAVTPLLVRVVDSSHREAVLGLMRTATVELDDAKSDTSLLGRLGRSGRTGDIARFAEGLAGSNDPDALEFLRALDARLSWHSTDLTRALAGLGDVESTRWGLEHAGDSALRYDALLVLAFASGPFADSAVGQWLRTAPALVVNEFISVMTPKYGLYPGLSRLLTRNVRRVKAARPDEATRAELVRAVQLEHGFRDPLDIGLLRELGCR